MSAPVDTLAVRLSIGTARTLPAGAARDRRLTSIADAAESLCDEVDRLRAEPGVTW